MNAAPAVILVAAALLLVASHRQSLANVEAGDALGSFSPDGIADMAETFFNVLTEQGANVDDATAQNNLVAFLGCIRRAEGTEQTADAYRVCFGYAHTISDLSGHPAITGEWGGERLSDDMCRNAGFGPGCISTAAGAYQITRPTWRRIAAKLGLQDFTPLSQDMAAIQLIRERGALADAQAGRFADAVRKCRNEWASLHGNYAGQGQRSLSKLAAWFTAAGGQLA